MNRGSSVAPREFLICDRHGGTDTLDWADENTSPTRKRGVGIIPRLRVGLVLKPLVQLLAAISSAHLGTGTVDWQFMSG